MSPIIPPCTAVGLYRICILRANRHAVATIVGEAFGTTVSAALLGNSIDTNAGTYQERPPREAVEAADVLMRHSEIHAGG